MASRLYLAPISLLAVLAGCGSQPQQPSTAGASGECTVDTLRGVRGQLASAERIEQTQRAAKASSVRVLAPGDVATMDHNLQRLNIHIDESETIIRLTCG